jgi:uncharacterized membrane protein YjfL (UPF0719 family)
MKYIILLQAIIAFVMGVSSMYLVYKLLNFYLKKVFGITELNAAFAAFQMGILIATSLLISAIVGPGMNAIRFINQADINFGSVSTSLGYVIMFLLIGLLFSFAVITGGVLVLFQLTHVNEWEEIKKNNIPVAMISAALIVGLSLVMRDHVAGVCEMLVPYPELMQIR